MWKSCILRTSSPLQPRSQRRRPTPHWCQEHRNQPGNSKVRSGEHRSRVSQTSPPSPTSPSSTSCRKESIYYRVRSKNISKPDLHSSESRIMVGEDSGDEQAASTDSTMTESGVPTDPASTEQQPGQGQQAGPAQQVEATAPAVQPRRFLTRTGAARRRASEATLMTSINQMELNTTWDNVHTHEESVRQMLSAL